MQTILLNAVNDLVWALNREGTCLIYLNQAAERIYGDQLPELARRPGLWLGAIHPNDKGVIVDHLDRLDILREFRHRFRVLDRQGQERWLDAVFTLITNEQLRAHELADETIAGDGQPAAVIGVVARDVTTNIRAERELDEARAIYETLAQNLPIKVFRKDRDGRVVFGNQLYCQAFGLTLEELLGKTDYDLFESKLAEKYVYDDHQVMATGEPLHGIEEHPGPDGTTCYVEVLKSPVIDSRGNRVGIQGMFWDVTERILSEKKLQSAKDLAEAASKAKGDFLANVSHEIRTPMNAIIGITELLIDSCRDKEQREYLSMIQQSSESLMTLLNDILDFSKIEAGKLELENVTFDLANRLADTLRTLAIRAQAKELELVFDFDPTLPTAIVGDLGRLRQVMVNLVSNAIKFTETGEVIVRVTSIVQSEDMAHLRLEVIDSGIGIPADRLEDIFHEFEQVHATSTRQYGGTGLGLAITRRLVQLIGGQLRVDSIEGSGSRFYFELHWPIDDSNAYRPRRRELAGVRGLLVEDHEPTRIALLRHFQAWEMEIDVATSAMDAMEKLNSAADDKRAYEFVLMDLTLRGGPSQVCKWIRRHPVLHALRIILMTSGQHVLQDDVVRDVDRVIKPIKPDDLYETMLAALGIDSKIVRDIDAAGTGGHGDGLRILLAEDNLINQRLASALLEKQGHRVTVVENGQLAVEEFLHGEYDFVLMDVQMPVLDGIEATMKIRRLEKTGKRIPIVALSAHVTDEFQKRCMAVGMDDYLTKPIRREKLFQLIEQLTGHRTSERETPVDATHSGRSIDWKHAFETVAGDRDLLEELIRVFLREQERMFHELEVALAEGDLRRLRRSAHSARGALGHLGATAAAEIAAELESMAQSGDLQNAPQRMERLQQEVKELVYELKRFTTNRR